MKKCKLFSGKTLPKKQKTNEFLSELALYLKVGTLQDAMRELSSEYSEIITSIETSLLAGIPLPEALSKTFSFSSLEIKILEASDRAGDMVKGLRAVIEFREMKKSDRGELLLVFFYPGAMMALVAVLGLFIVYGILPKLAPTFLALQIELPFATKILVFLAETLKTKGIWILLGVIGLITGFFTAFRKIITFRSWVEIKILKLPIIGLLIHENALVSYLSILSMLCRYSNNIHEHIMDARIALPFHVLELEALHMADMLRKGGSIRTKDKLLLGPRAEALLSAAFHAGAFEETLHELELFYSKNLKKRKEKILKLMEPILLLGLGLVVALLAYAIMSPFYEMQQGFRKLS